MPPPLCFHPPLLNSACPWATSQDDLAALLRCPATGAVTTRTCTPAGFPHDAAVHRYAFLDPSSGAGPTPPRGPVASINSLGYSPVPLAGYIDMLRRLADLLPPPVTRKTVIVSVVPDSIRDGADDVTAAAASVAECYARLAAAAPGLPFPLAMELNLGCPNLPAAPSPLLAARLAAALPAPSASGSGPIPLGIKLPPLTHASHLAALVDALGPLAPRLSFLTATNTLGCCLLFDAPDRGAAGALQGGLAGPPLHPLALGNVAALRRLLDDTDELRHILLIGVGGVSDGQGYRRMRKAGAGAVGLATGLGAKGLAVFEDIARDLASSWD